MRTAPILVVQASVSKQKGLEKSGIAKTGAKERDFSRASKASSWTEVQTKRVFFFNSQVRGLARTMKNLTNFL